MLKCAKCKEWKGESAFYGSPTTSRGYFYPCKRCVAQTYQENVKLRDMLNLCVTCGRERDRAGRLCASCWNKAHYYRAKLKRETLEAYGGSFCNCCGEDQIDFLSIDHINGDGSKHRRGLGRTDRRQFHRWLKRNGYPSGYQVLCMNCNFAKRDSCSCPHEIKKEIVLNWNKDGQITYSEEAFI